MMKKYLLIMLLVSTTMAAWAGGGDDNYDWNPSEKYAKWCRSFRVDKVWQFSKEQHVEHHDQTSTRYKYIMGEDNNPDAYVSTVDCPGFISWSVMSWNDKNNSSDEYSFDWLNVYLYDNGHQTEYQIAYIDYDGNDNYTPLSITNKNGNKTYHVATVRNRKYHDGSYFNYFVTEYTDELREFIQTAGNGCQLYIHCRWDGTHWHEHKEKANLAFEDRQFFPNPDAPSLTFNTWTEQNGHTALEYTLNPNNTSSETKVYAKINGDGNKTLQDWSKLSSATYTTPLSNIATVTADMLEQQQVTLYAQNRIVYSATPQHYLIESEYPSSFTKTLTSSIASARPVILAQPTNLKASDDGRGNVNINWNMKVLAGNAQYDDCNIVLERSQTADFSSNITSHEITYNRNTSKYSFTDSFDERNEGQKKFYYRLRRKNAAFGEPDIQTSAYVQTDYVSIKDLKVQQLGNKAVLTWAMETGGIWNDDMYVELSDYNATTTTSAEPKRFDSKATTYTILLNTCERHDFTLAVKQNGISLNQQSVLGFAIPNDAPSVIQRYSVSKGFYNDHVNISWTIDQEQSNFTSFVLQRRRHDSTDDTDWQSIYSCDYRNRVFTYSYDDNTAVPGVYYDYRLEGYSRCDETENLVTISEQLGFAQPYGIVTGQVTYEGNQGVEGVRIYATGEADRVSRALKFQRDIASYATLDSAQATQVLGKKAGTMEMWVYPTDNNWNQLVYKQGTVDWFITDNQQLQLTVYSQQQPYTVTADLNAETSAWKTDEYNHITASYNINQNGQILMTLYVNGNLEGSVTHQLTGDQLDMQNTALYMGTNHQEANATSYDGYMDEIRFWNVCRDSAKITNAMHGYLSGNEEGLTAYYRADDDVATELYDLSKTNYRFNERHMTMAGVAANPNYVPTAEQLSLSTVTDELGNYMLNAVPYNSDGTLYQIVPALGTHEFSPSNRPLFFDRNTSTQNNINFTDKSSFPVSGHIYYAGTDYPVQGVTFYVDAIACSNDGNLIQTDEQGAYTIQVPIGKHRIQAKMDGHTFVNDGYFPRQEGTDKTYYEFAHAENQIDFTDNTLVILTGRVAGGTIQDSLPHGMQLGTNNIGTARIAISPVKKQMYHLNLDEQHERVWKTPETTEVKSKAVTRKNDSGTHAMYLTITTDSTTGEFSVLLPPVDFSVDSVSVPTNDKININTAAFGTLELSKCSDAHLKTDSIRDSQTGELRAFQYIAALDINHRVRPTLDVTPDKSETGLYGEMYHVVTDPTTGNDTILELIHTDSAGVSHYVYDVPFYHQGNTYTMDLHCYELYVNHDNAEPATDTVPVAHSLVTIANQLGSALQGNTIEMDSLGKGQYTFMAGEPNIAEAPEDVRYLLYTTMQYTNSEQNETYQWETNKDARGIVLGNKSDGGTNFVTQGPSLLHYILRDPAGSKSSATLKESSSYTHSVTSTSSIKHNGGGGADVNFGMNATSAEGFGIMIINSFKAKDELDTRIVGGQKTETMHNSSTTYTLTDAITTGNGSKYVNSKGDIFMGLSTNLNVSDVRCLDFYMQADGQYALDVHDATHVGQEYTTHFYLTQYDIVNYEIPSLLQLRNQLLQTVPDTAAVTHQDPNVYTYYTTLSQDDPHFGEEGTYKAIAPSDATAFNMVRYYNEQVAIWKQYLAYNEQIKVDAIYNGKAKKEHNISIDGGMKYSNTSTIQTKRDTTIIITNNWDFSLKNKWGFLINSVGIVTNQELTVNKTWGSNTSDTHINTTEVSYNIEQNNDEKLSVTIYEGTDGYGPIFSTVAGQTYCPYEGEEKTKYYEPGRYILNTATQPMQIPKLSCAQPSVTGVPVGGKAMFTIQLNNEAFTSLPTEFTLEVDPASNPHGAQVTAGGLSLIAPIPFYLTPSQPITQTITLEQSDLSVTKYDRLALIMRSGCEVLRTDTLYLTAEFVQSCVDAQLSVNKTVVNSDNGCVVRLTASGYDKNLSTFNGLRLEYKRPADINWQQVISVGKDALEGTYTYNWDMSGLTDGQYQVRATTVCSFGGTEVPSEGAPVTIIKDTSAPTNLGLPTPINGIYTADNQIYVDFNEPIQKDRVTTPNVVVEGVLNAHVVSHNIALEHPSHAQFYTEAAYNLQNTPFTLEGWFYLDKSNTDGAVLMSHKWTTGNETENRMHIALNPSRHLVMLIDGQNYTSTGDTLPMNEWFYLMVSYKPMSDTTAEVSAYYAADNHQACLMEQIPVKAYHARGNLSFGLLTNLRMHDVSLWNHVRTWSTAQSQMHRSKEIYANELISYWPMNEASGRVANDVIRHRNLVLSNGNWWFNHPNYALSLHNGETARMSVAHKPLETNENYLLEFWFNMEHDGVLFTLGDVVKVATSQDNLVMIVGEASHLLKVSKTLADSNWHHFALQNKMGMPDVYIDKENCRAISSYGINSTVNVAYITLGDTANTGTYSFDEVRLWKGFVSRDYIEQNMHTRMYGNEDGLTAYYPMDAYVQNEYNQTEVHFSLSSQNINDSIQTNGLMDVRRDTLLTSMSFAQAVSVPTLMELRPKESVNHTFTASDNRIVINVTESAQRIEGCTLEFTVKDIVDENGNYSAPIHWTAYVNRNQLLWGEHDMRISKTALSDTSFTLTIINNSAQMENWNLSNVPEWLTFSQTSGVLQPLGELTLTATVDASLAIGEYDQTIYLCGNQNIDAPLYLTVKVTADAPNWHINPADYEYAMHMVARVRVNGALGDDEEDMVAAFINGQLVGVAHPTFYPSYNCHYVVMDIYQNLKSSQQNQVLADKEIQFALWDASSGIIFTPMQIYLFGNKTNTPDSLLFCSGSLVGNFSQPIELRNSDLVEQTIHYEKGWNWVSLNILLTNSDRNNDFYTQYGQQMENLSIIKTQDQFAQFDSLRNQMMGSLRTLDSIGAYKTSVTNAMTIKHRGRILQPQFYGLTLKANKWTWIPYLPQMALSVNMALSNLTPQTGDIIKSRSGFALYDGLQWIGSLTAMSPGNAYIYYNAGSTNQVLYYPSINVIAFNSHHLLAPARSMSAYDPISSALYQNNMTVTAVVMDGASQVMDAEVGVFAGEECRAASMLDEYGYAYLTIPGEQATPLTFRVMVAGQEINAEQTLLYTTDAIVGSPTAPYIIQIGEETGMENLDTPLYGVEKIMIDGVLYIIKNGVRYTVLGTRL